mgnify:CR=1 FL=1
MVTQDITDIDRTKAARARRRMELTNLRHLPYRNKEQEGRYVWLRKQVTIDRVHAEKEANGAESSHP